MSVHEFTIGFRIFMLSFFKRDSPLNAAFGASVLQTEVQKVEGKRFVHGCLIALFGLI